MSAGNDSRKNRGKAAVPPALTAKAAHLEKMGFAWK